MRLSVIPGDPGYHPRAHLFFTEVWVDGRRFERDVVTADTTTGEVVRFVYPDDGIPPVVAGEEQYVMERFAHVQIRGVVPREMAL